MHDGSVCYFEFNAVCFRSTCTHTRRALCGSAALMVSQHTFALVACTTRISRFSLPFPLLDVDYVMYVRGFFLRYSCVCVGMMSTVLRWVNKTLGGWGGRLAAKRLVGHTHTHFHSTNARTRTPGCRVGIGVDVVVDDDGVRRLNRTHNRSLTLNRIASCAVAKQNKAVVTVGRQAQRRRNT